MAESDWCLPLSEIKYKKPDNDQIKKKKVKPAKKVMGTKTTKFHKKLPSKEISLERIEPQDEVKLDVETIDFPRFNKR